MCYNSLVVVITSILTNFTPGLWKDLDVGLSLTSSKEMVSKALSNIVNFSLKISFVNGWITWMHLDLSKKSVNAKTESNQYFIEGDHADIYHFSQYPEINTIQGKTLLIPRQVSHEKCHHDKMSSVGDKQP